MLTPKDKFRPGDDGYILDPLYFLSDDLNRPQNRYRKVTVIDRTRVKWIVEIDGKTRRFLLSVVLTKTELDALPSQQLENWKKNV